MALSRKTSNELVTYALIGAAAAPIAYVGGEVIAAVFCIVAVLVTSIARKRR
jgi:hypothetical protein